jgi:hypothetical protein
MLAESYKVARRACVELRRWLHKFESIIEYFLPLFKRFVKLHSISYRAKIIGVAPAEKRARDKSGIGKAR